jgi:hypothetical protein
MSKRTKRLEKYLGRFMMIALVIYCSIDFINYFVIFTDYGIDTSFVTSKQLSGTARNKRWDITYDYYANETTYRERIFDITPFSNTFKRNKTLFVYYYNKKPSKHIIIQEKLENDFRPSIMHYLSLDRNSVFYLSILLFLLFIKLLPLFWAIIYTIVGVLLIKIFRPIKYKRFITRRKEKIYEESIGRIINKFESLRY